MHAGMHLRRHENPVGLVALSKHSWSHWLFSYAQGFEAVWKHQKVESAIHSAAVGI